MRLGIVYYNSIKAGTLEKEKNEYIFTYYDEYLNDTNLPSISLTLRKRKEPYRSNILFPFFFGLLAEGTIKDIQCRALKIDEEDHFTRLIKTAGSDTIGAVTVKGVE